MNKNAHSGTEQPDFIRRQYEFAAHIRDPAHRPAPAGIEDRRMGIYRELFYNNVEGFLSGTFPVLRRILDDTTWHALIRDYFSQHLSHTPLFLEMPREFLAWLGKERGEQAEDPPFLAELAHYEWVELALSISEDTLHSDQIDRQGDLLQGTPVLSPLAWHLAYRFPVHRIGPDFLPQQPASQPTCLVVYRDRADNVGFMEVNPVTKRLLELVDTTTSASGTELLVRIAEEMDHPQPEVVIRSGSEILQGLLQKDIILGTRRLHSHPTR
ncbi:MAG: putative DNA-binding domain-containing protein [Gammaproteobacteria bacterium]